jgi:hypothetical protein
MGIYPDSLRDSQTANRKTQTATTNVLAAKEGCKNPFEK